MASEYMIYPAKEASLVFFLILFGLAFCWLASAGTEENLKTQIKEVYNIRIEETTRGGAELSSSEGISFLQSFQKEAQTQGLPRSPVEIKVIVYEENWTIFQVGPANSFGADVEFVSFDWINVGSESAEAAVNMLRELIDFRVKNDEGFQLLASLGIIMKCASFPDPGQDECFGFMESFTEELKQRNILTQTGQKIKIEVVEEKGNPSGGHLLRDGPDMTEPDLFGIQRILVGDQSHSAAIDLLINDYEFVESKLF